MISFPLPVLQKIELQVSIPTEENMDEQRLQEIISKSKSYSYDTYEDLPQAKLTYGKRNKNSSDLVVVIQQKRSTKGV